MKVIFLDNDGVICLGSNWGGRFKKMRKFIKKNPLVKSESEAPVHCRFDNFDLKCIKVINDIILETDCEIVVSSDWRKHATLEELGDYYLAQGLIKKPIGLTKFINQIDVPANFEFDFMYRYEQERTLEIKDYLKEHSEITHWVAIDDLSLGNHEFVPKSDVWGLSNFVRCISLNEGIKRTGLKEQIINFLK